jgi:hypothetical protein
MVNKNVLESNVKKCKDPATAVCKVYIYKYVRILSERCSQVRAFKDKIFICMSITYIRMLCNTEFFIYLSH